MLIKTTFFILFFSISCSSMKTQNLKPVKAVSNTPECVDFLSKWKLNHNKITYSGCMVEPESKIQPKLMATYEVTGKDAKAVEKYLVERFGMKKLVFVCCGWSPKAKNSSGIPLDYLGQGTYTDSQFINPFTISLSSGETTEKNWNKIKFKVTVETNYTEI